MPSTYSNEIKMRKCSFLGTLDGPVVETRSCLTPRALVSEWLGLFHLGGRPSSPLP